MNILQTPRFAKQVKKLQANQKQALDAAVKLVAGNPALGTQKRDDLSFLRVYKFKMLEQQALLAYSYDEKQIIITLLAVGSHENFYRDLKR
ncbi:MAG TPA: type II toxin-antitoxin system RelE/ParE family toxin [Ghiorsea sp.]|nr:type II toxin-antitoxin system RelE/ParE family toxin [Ghiorsea sp.]HIP07058.1 type II toxin-antitoxin system RelE/ParE family toxin [Mariprofundaceae bacterium]